MLPQFTAIIAVFIIVGTISSQYIAIALFLSAIFMILASFNINQNHKTSVMLAYNNKNLISDLSKEIDVRERVQLELEQSKSGLEIKVKERT